MIGSAHTGSTTVTPIPWSESRWPTATAGFGKWTDTHNEHPRLLRRQEYVDPLTLINSRKIRRNRTPGEADHARAVVDRQRSRQRVAQADAVARRGELQAGHDLQDRHVPHAVMAGPIRSRDTGPVEHERDAALVQCDIHQDLIKGAIEEGRIHRDDRMQATHRQTGR